MYSAFNCVKEIDNLLNIWLGVSIFSPCPCCYLLNPRIFAIFSVLFYLMTSFEGNSVTLSERYSKLLLIFSATSFLLRFSKLSKFSNISLGLWYSKYFLNNSFFYFLFLIFNLLFEHFCIIFWFRCLILFNHFLILKACTCHHLFYTT